MVQLKYPSRQDQKITRSHSLFLLELPDKFDLNAYFNDEEQTTATQEQQQVGKQVYKEDNNGNDFNGSNKIGNSIGKTLKIKSESDGQPAVLCTFNKTFALRNVLSSNTLLIADQIPNDHHNDDNIERDFMVLCENFNFIECVETLPKVDTILDLLVPFSGQDIQENENEDHEKEEDDDECKINKNKFQINLNYLDEHIQASVFEIQTYLASIHAFELNGEYRVLELSFAKYLLDLLLASLMSEGYDFNFSLLDHANEIHHVDDQDDDDIAMINNTKEKYLTSEFVYRLLNDELRDEVNQGSIAGADDNLPSSSSSSKGTQIPFVVAETLLEKFGQVCLTEKNELVDDVHDCDSEKENIKKYYILSPLKVGQFYAEFLFNTQSRTWPLTDFLSTWSHFIPPCFQLDIRMLNGLALIEDYSLASSFSITNPSSSNLNTTANTIIQSNVNTENANPNTSNTFQDSKMVRYFPKSQVLALSQGDIRLRFDLLFALKRKWGQEELLAYISDLDTTSSSSTSHPSTGSTGTGNGGNSSSTALDAILLKYARVAKSSDAVYYTSRFPISTKMVGLLKQKHFI